MRDATMLEASLARPQATAFGEDAYPTLDTKAAALVHAIAKNHPLVDGNKRLVLGSLIAFYGLNGFRLTLDNDGAYALIIAIAAGELDDVDAIAARLAESRELADWR